MMTITAEAKATFAKAGRKARAEKPLVRKTDKAEVWLVRSSDKKNFYTVTFSKNGQGELTADCTCPNAKKGSKHNCKHPAAAFDLMKQAVNNRAVAKATPTPATNEPAPEPASSIEVECRVCGDFWPEAAMSGAGYNPICPNCLLFG